MCSVCVAKPWYAGTTGVVRWLPLTAARHWSQVKKGVKRKADTTTPAMSGTPDPPFAASEPKVAKVGNKRRESGRQIKKVVKDLPDSQAPPGKGREKMQESMRACNEILKELFSKKHSVS